MKVEKDGRKGDDISGLCKVRGQLVMYSCEEAEVDEEDPLLSIYVFEIFPPFNRREENEICNERINICVKMGCLPPFTSCHMFAFKWSD